MSSRVYPEKRVSPLIREFDLDNMITLGASGSISLENRIRARAAAVHTLQDQVSSLVICNARRTTCFAEDSPLPYAIRERIADLYAREMSETSLRISSFGLRGVRGGGRIAPVSFQQAFACRSRISLSAHLN